MSKKIGIIIQARLTGKRFPNKVLSMLNGNTIISYVTNELKKIKGIPIVMAIPDNPMNDPLEVWCIMNDVKCYRSIFEHDVLGRFYYCANKYKFDIIVRVNGETPFIKAKDILDNMMKFTYEKEKRMIYGNGSWVFNMDMLRDAHRTQYHSTSREHVVRSMFNAVDYIDDIPRLEKYIKDGNVV